MATTTPQVAEMPGPTVIEFGPYEIDTTCSSSPYPSEISGASRLYICEFCLEYTVDASDFSTHTANCSRREPCGKEIYSKGGLSVFEVDGALQPRYCTNLCLHMQLFIDHKRKDFNVEDFHYYILTVNSVGKGNEMEKHIAGCFSKKKLPAVLNNNLSCVLILPQFQRQGYGRFLIDFSYLLSRVEKKSGTPEKPLSRVGLATYQSYWRSCVGKFLYANISVKSMSVKSISEHTGIDPYDIADTLQRMNFVKQRQGRLSIVIKEKVLKEQMAALESKKHVAVDEEYLEWTPPQPPPPLLPPLAAQQNNVLTTKSSEGNDNEENKDSSDNNGNLDNENNKDKDLSDDHHISDSDGKSNKDSDDSSENVISKNSDMEIKQDKENDSNSKDRSTISDNSIENCESRNDENKYSKSENESNKSSENNHNNSHDDIDNDNNSNNNYNNDDDSDNKSRPRRRNNTRNLRKQKTANKVMAIDNDANENDNKRKTRRNETGKRKNLRSMASDEDQQLPEPPPMKTRLRRGRAGSR